jgi:hypothetical protein
VSVEQRRLGKSEQRHARAQTRHRRRLAGLLELLAASAATSKASVRGGWRNRLTGVSVIAVFMIADAFRGGGLAVRSVILAAIGAALFVGGIGLAVWARLRCWGRRSSTT